MLRSLLLKQRTEWDETVAVFDYELVENGWNSVKPISVG